MTIDKIKVQPTPPKSNCLMWAYPNGDTVDLKINVKGKWTPVGGSSSSSTTISPNITNDELQALYDSGVTKVTVEGIGEGVLQTREGTSIYCIEFKEYILAPSPLGDYTIFPKYMVKETSDMSNSNTEENQENSVISFKRILESVINRITLEDVNLHELPNLTNVIQLSGSICYLYYYNKNASTTDSESVWSGTDPQGNLVQLFVKGTKHNSFG